MDSTQTLFQKNSNLLMVPRATTPVITGCLNADVAGHPLSLGENDQVCPVTFFNGYLRSICISQKEYKKMEALGEAFFDALRRCYSSLKKPTVLECARHRLFVCDRRGATTKVRSLTSQGATHIYQLPYFLAGSMKAPDGEATVEEFLTKYIRSYYKTKNFSLSDSEAIDLVAGYGYLCIALAQCCSPFAEALVLEPHCTLRAVMGAFSPAIENSRPIYRSRNKSILFDERTYLNVWNIFDIDMLIECTAEVIQVLMQPDKGYSLLFSLQIALRYYHSAFHYNGGLKRADRSACLLSVLENLSRCGKFEQNSSNALIYGALAGMFGRYDHCRRRWGCDNRDAVRAGIVLQKRMDLAVYLAKCFAEKMQISSDDAALMLFEDVPYFVYLLYLGDAKEIEACIHDFLQKFALLLENCYKDGFSVPSLALLISSFFPKDLKQIHRLKEELIPSAISWEPGCLTHIMQARGDSNFKDFDLTELRKWHSICFEMVDFFLTFARQKICTRMQSLVFAAAALSFYNAEAQKHLVIFKRHFDALAKCQESQKVFLALDSWGCRFFTRLLALAELGQGEKGPVFVKKALKAVLSADPEQQPREEVIQHRLFCLARFLESAYRHVAIVMSEENKQSHFLLYLQMFVDIWLEVNAKEAFTFMSDIDRWSKLSTLIDCLFQVAAFEALETARKASDEALADYVKARAIFLLALLRGDPKRKGIMKDSETAWKFFSASEGVIRNAHYELLISMVRGVADDFMFLENVFLEKGYVTFEEGMISLYTVFFLNALCQVSENKRVYFEFHIAGETKRGEKTIKSRQAAAETGAELDEIAKRKGKICSPHVLRYGSAPALERQEPPLKGKVTGKRFSHQCVVQ